MTQASDIRGATICIAKAGLTNGTTTTYTTGAATGGSIGGKFVTALSAQTNTANPTTDGNGDAFTALAANQGTVFVYTLNAGGTLKVFQGSVEACDDTDTFNVAPSFPDINLEAYMPFGYVVVTADSTASAWTLGASNYNATGITQTYHDVTTLPLRPQTS